MVFNKKRKKVVMAMSGGVDSSAAAALLVEQGYEVIGVFMQFWFPKGVVYGENRCCSLESFYNAKEVADKLGIPIHKINMGRDFKKNIVDEFLNDYGAGKTPNPCVACNKFIKFDALLDQALKVFEADYLATGHYVEVKKRFGKYRMYRAKDKNKDQSYFLYNQTQDTLKHLLFPVARYNKDQIRKIAKKFGLSVHSKKDSQEICFVGKDHNSFLEKFLQLKPGIIVDEKGNKLGKHKGLALYTIGQRSGIKLPNGPWYVCGFKRLSNQLVVTKDRDNLKMFSKFVVFDKEVWLSGRPNKAIKCQAKIRYRSKLHKCSVAFKDGQWVAEFYEPQKAVAVGQSIVLYKGDEVLGGGVIKSIS